MSAGPVRLEQVESIDSTNAELMRREVHGSDDTVCALWAQQQTAGRGRQGRIWHSQPQDAITLSVALNVSAPVSALLGLPLAIGVALAEVLQREGAALWIKWPNDLYRIDQDRPAKVGGILTEVKPLGEGRHRVVSGFGLNLFAPPEGLRNPQSGPRGEGTESQWSQSTSSPGPSPVAAGAIFGPQARACMDRAALAQGLADAVADVMRRYPEAGLAPWLDGWRRRDLLAGRAITVHHPDGRREPAQAKGIDAQGALQIIDALGGARTLTSAEVSVRLQAGSAGII